MQFLVGEIQTPRIGEIHTPTIGEIRTPRIGEIRLPTIEDITTPDTETVQSGYRYPLVGLDNVSCPADHFGDVVLPAGCKIPV